MKSAVLTVALVFLSLANFASASDAVVGTWKITMGQRSRTSILKVRHEREKLTAVMLHHLGHQTKIDDVRYVDGEISFEVQTRRRGREFVTKYTGRLSDGSMKGKVTFQFRGQSRDWEWIAHRTHDTPTAATQVVVPVAADIDLTEENYEVWREHILPDSDELAWASIPWLTTFKDGILAADTEGKPLLLWTMNGHPLGCT